MQRQFGFLSWSHAELLWNDIESRWSDGLLSFDSMPDWGWTRQTRLLLIGSAVLSIYTHKIQLTRSKLCFNFPETLYSLMIREHVFPSASPTPAIVIVLSVMTSVVVLQDSGSCDESAAFRKTWSSCHSCRIIELLRSSQIGRRQREPDEVISDCRKPSWCYFWVMMLYLIWLNHDLLLHVPTCDIPSFCFLDF